MQKSDQPRHCTRHGRIHVAGAGAGQGAGCTHGFVLVRSGLIRNGDRCVAFSWGKFWSYIPRHPGTTTSSSGATEPRPAAEARRHHQSSTGERPRTALSARVGNAFRTDAPEAGYGFWPNFVIGEWGSSGTHCRAYNSLGGGSAVSGTCLEAIYCFGRLRRTPGSSLCGVSLLVPLEHSERPRKDYANQPVEQTDERREAISRWPRRSVCFTGRRHRASVPHAHFWWRAPSTHE